MGRLEDYWEARALKAEAQLDKVRDLRIKPMRQGGWTFDKFLNKLDKILKAE